MIGKNYRLTKDMQEAAAALELPLASTALTLRQVYADAPGQGTIVGEMGSRAKPAAAEIESLFAELVPQSGRNKHRKLIAAKGKE